MDTAQPQAPGTPPTPPQTPSMPSVQTTTTPPTPPAATQPVSPVQDGTATTPPAPTSKGKFSPLLIIVIGVFLLAIIGAGVFVASSKKATPAPVTPAATVEPTATPTPSLQSNAGGTTDTDLDT